MIKLYNTLSRKKEIFKPIKAGEVGIYSCGPTVYWYQHIGNMRMYLNWDILKRVLEFNGLKVKHVMNVTDVGHLTSDADEGEDKMEKAAAKEGRKASEIAEFYLKAFRDDFKRLNIIEPNIWSKATEHVKEQIELIKILEKKGYTYKTSDGIYFNSLKFKNYSKFARINKEGLKAGQRIDTGEKKNKTDFALWKFSEEKGKRQQEWNSPWGLGFPGWHIECSAMSMKYLGETIDIHTGGQEHIQVHHTNEIAQSEAATEKQFVKYWLHGAWLLYKGEKISKSSGGLYTISELENNGINPLAFRYFCLTTHYRKPMNFSMEKLDSAKTALIRLKNIISELKDDKVENKKYLDKFSKVISDDLNMPEALQILWKFVRDEKAKGKFQTIKKFDQVLGLDLFKKEEIKLPLEIKKLLEERQKTRKEKDWKRSDEIREKIRSLGFAVEDSPDGQSVRKI